MLNLATRTAADHTQFSLYFADTHCDVINFTGDNDGLSSDYEFQITVACSEQLIAKKILMQRVRLQLAKDSYRHGIITQLEYIGPRAQHFIYQLRFHSPLVLLKESQHNRVFTQQSLTAILKKIIFDLPNSICFNNDIFINQQIVQYKESDFDFMQRLFTRFGINSFFIQTADDYQLILYDDIEKISHLSKLHHLDNELHSFQRFSFSHFDSIHLCAHNLAKAKIYSVKTSNQTSDKGQGICELNEYCCSDRTQAQDIAAGCQQQLDWQRQQYLLKTTFRTLSAGMLISVNTNTQPSYYRILNIRHEGQQQAGLAYFDDQDSQRNYFAEVTLIPQDRIYKRCDIATRFPYQQQDFKTSYVHHAVAARRNYQGFHCASIEGNDAHSPLLSLSGEYYLRFHYADETQPLTRNSAPINFAQTYTGRHHQGLHFPLRPGNEVIVAYLFDDLDLPFIIGVRPNRIQPSPVTSENHLQNIIRSECGHEIIFDDTHKRQAIQLATAQRENSFSLCNETDNTSVLLHSLQHNIFLCLK